MRRLNLFPRWLPIVRFLLCVGLLWTAPDTAQSQEERRTEVIRLHRASADEVAKTIEALMPASDAIVTPEPISNAIIVSAPEEIFREIEAWISKLDGVPEHTIQIYPLANRPAEEAADLLTAILSEDPRVEGVSIVADVATNALVVRSSEEGMRVIQDLLKVLDVEQPSNNRRFTKVFALRYADAAERRVLKMLPSWMTD